MGQVVEVLPIHKMGQVVEVLPIHKMGQVLPIHKMEQVVEVLPIHKNGTGGRGAADSDGAGGNGGDVPCGRLGAQRDGIGGGRVDSGSSSGSGSGGGGGRVGTPSVRFIVSYGL